MWIALLACAASCAECGRGDEERRADPGSAAKTETKEPNADDAVTAISDSCAAARKAMAAAPTDPEVERYYQALPRIVLKTRLVPVLYATAPAPPADPRAAEIRRRLDGAGAFAERVLRQELKAARGDRALLRGALLRGDTLFSADPDVASALVKVLGLPDLFDDEVVFRDRGEGVERLTRAAEVYVDGSGARADLLLNDRLARAEAELSSLRSFALGAVRAVTGAERVTPVIVGADRAAVRLAYASGWSTGAILSREGTRTVVECVEGEPSRVVAERERAGALREWRGRVRAAAARMVAERPGFDEPSDEIEGEQEDGVLRSEWLKAYQRYERSFFYREHEYPVFDRRGNPIPPEVCIDFVFDVWERASGTWFEPRGRRPRRTAGALDFAVFPGLWRRHIPSILEFAARGGPPLLRHDLPPRDVAPLRSFGAMADALARNGGAFQEGDVLVIHGLREEDGEEHYHAVLVLDADPLTGLPMVVADNAGRPRIRPLVSAMRSAPRRAVKHRLRLDPDWLLAALEGHAENDAGRVVDGGARP